MATFTAIENNPITVNLLTQANDTGWSVLAGGIAKHISCNSGFITLLNYPVVAGHAYKITYTILTISGGYVSAWAGNTEGAHHTTANIIVETIVATNTDAIKLFSTANCTVQLFNIQDITITDPVSIFWSEINKKWSDNRTVFPSFGFSLLDLNVLVYQGNVYVQQNGSDNRNNFFGVDYQSSIKFIDAKNSDAVNGFESLNYQANMLLVSTQDGITTDLGQVSTLIDTDFIKEKLQSAGLTVINYQKDNVYSASFLPDSNEDAVNGSGLRGRHIIIELITADGSTPLRLFSVEVKKAYIPIGPR